jgi:hypothetical protein
MTNFFPSPVQKRVNALGRISIVVAGCAVIASSVILVTVLCLSLCVVLLVLSFRTHFEYPSSTRRITKRVTFIIVSVAAVLLLLFRNNLV